MPDTKIGDCEVYVLELRMPYKKLQPRGRYLPNVRRIYLAKSDLLPRKVEEIGEQSGVLGNPRGMPGNTTTYYFSGFIANSRLSGSLFPTQPPKGAKPIRP